MELLERIEIPDDRAADAVISAQMSVERAGEYGSGNCADGAWLSGTASGRPQASRFRRGSGPHFFARGDIDAQQTSTCFRFCGVPVRYGHVRQPVAGGLAPHE